MITGTGVHDRPESAFTIDWNECSRSTGIGVHDPPERAVDGTLVAQVACDQPRPDLAGKFGLGRHGFRYEFRDASLPGRSKVAVQFQATGRLLANGAHTIDKDLALETHGQNVRRPPSDAHMRPLDWPRMQVDVRADDADLAAMIGRVEAMFQHLGESDEDIARAGRDSYLAARITERPQEFFEFGKTPVRQFVATLARSDIATDGLDICFELGCGIGRSTVWLAEQFRSVIAADVSEPAVNETRRNLARFDRQNAQVVHTNRIELTQRTARAGCLLFDGRAAT